MCANYGNLEKEVKELEEGGIGAGVVVVEGHDKGISKADGACYGNSAGKLLWDDNGMSLSVTKTLHFIRK